MRPQLGPLVTAALVASCQPRPATQPPVDPGTQATDTPATVDVALVVTNVRVFDGAQVLVQQTVMVNSEGVIVAVGPTGSLEVPAATHRIDGTGNTLLPGFIDAHTHVHAAQDLRQALVFGVTTELDMFANPSMVARIKKKQARGKGHDTADLRSAGTLVTAPGGHGTEYGASIPTLTQASDADQFVAARIAEGSDYIKVVFDDGSGYGAQIPTLGPDTLAAVVEAAHKHKRQAVVHIGSQEQAITALDAGADGLAHMFMDSAATPAFLERAKNGAFITDTLAVTVAMCEPSRHQDLVQDPNLGPFLTPLEGRSLSKGFPFPEGKPRPTCAHVFSAVKAAHDAGAMILASTDAPNPGTLHGASLHADLAHLVAAGLTPIEALRAATSAPAQVFGLVDRGRIAENQRADLVLVGGDPTVDIQATRHILEVWKGGHRVDREAYRERVKRVTERVEQLSQRPPPAGSESGLIADFESGKIEAAFGSGWQPSRAGESLVDLKVVPKGARKSKFALQIRGTIAAASLPNTWAGASFLTSLTAMHSENLSGFRRLRFWVRSRTTDSITVMLFDQKLGAVPAHTKVKVSKRWTEVVLEVAETFDLESMSGLQAVYFGGPPTAGEFAFQIDGIRFD